MDAQMMLAMGLPGGFGAKNKTSRSQIRGAAAGALANNEQTPQKSTAQKALLISSLKISSDQVNGLQAKSDNYGQKPQDRVESETTREVEITDDDNSSVYSNDDETIPNNSCQLTSHSRAVTGMALDPACSRLLTSSRDYSVKFWDFHSMTSTLHPFFSFEPSETNPVRSMNYNLNGSLFLCCSTAQAKLYSRDGEEMCEYARGDPYLRDLRHTKGHTSSINRCMFHPYDRAEFMTCASDSTVRLWNVEVKDTQRDVICVKSKKGVNGRCLITAASYSRDGKNIAAAGDDGVLRIWNSKGPYIIPTMQLEKAHTSGSPITSLQFSSNHQEFITKCMDDTVKLWDIRNFKGPVATKTGVTSFYEESNAIYSPYERFVVCGISGRKDSQPQQGKRDTLKTAPQMNPADSNPGDNGGLLFLDAKTLELHERREMNGGVSAVTLMWSDPISQLFVGCGDGSVQIMYDPDKSTGGIVLPLSKSRKKLAVDDYEVVVDHVLDVPPEDFTGDIEDFRVMKERKRLYVMEREKTRPDNPHLINKHGKGRLGSSLTHHIMAQKTKNESRHQDPREAILAYADIAEKDPYWIAPAYEGNTRILAAKVHENKLELEREEKKRRRK